MSARGSSLADPRSRSIKTVNYFLLLTCIAVLAAIPLLYYDSESTSTARGGDISIPIAFFSPLFTFATRALKMSGTIADTGEDVSHTERNRAHWEYVAHLMWNDQTTNGFSTVRWLRGTLPNHGKKT